MGAGSDSTRGWRGWGLEGVSPGALVLAAAVPVLFLHVHYQPGLAVALGSTTVNAYLSDFAVLAVVVSAIAAAIRRGWAPLRRGRTLWLAGLLFLAWVFVEVALGRLHSAAYAWHTHGVTAAKFAEYALLAPAVPLLLCRTADRLAVLWSLVLWSCLATSVGIAQFFGARIFLAGTVGRRQASFLSSADFAALSSATVCVAVVALAWPGAHLPRPLARLAAVSGVLGMIVAGAIASVLGLVTAIAAFAVVLLLGRERIGRSLVVACTIGAVVIAGAVAIRGSDLDAFARFLGATPGKQATHAVKIQTYAHRTLLSWIGYRIWLDHPVLGVGWEGSAEPTSFVPYLPAARRRFPNEAPTAFPSAAPDRRYGVQDSWIQALADLGVVGLVLWAAPFAAAARLAGTRAVRDGAPVAALALLWLGVLVWLWTAQGYIAGIPLDALTWLALGAAALGAPDE